MADAWPTDEEIDAMGAGPELDALVCKVVGMVGLAPSRDDADSCRALDWAAETFPFIRIERVRRVSQQMWTVHFADGVPLDICNHFGAEDPAFRVAIARAVAKTGRRA